MATDTSNDSEKNEELTRAATALLGLNPDFTIEELNHAFWKLSREYQLGRSRVSTDGKLVEINGAYGCLLYGKNVEDVRRMIMDDFTYDQLLDFLKQDNTVDMVYEPGVYVCKEFARALKSNAEKKGIKSFLVKIYFKDQAVGHMINAFRTKDYGLVYIDVTGGTLEQRAQHDRHVPCYVKLHVGEEYLPIPCWHIPNMTYLPMGIVSNIQIEELDLWIHKDHNKRSAFQERQRPPDPTFSEILWMIDNANPIITRLGIDYLSDRKYFHVDTAINLLVEFLYSHDYQLKDSAVISLGLIGDSNVVSRLALLLNDEYKHIRSDVAEALGRIGDTSALDFLHRVNTADPLNDEMVMKKVKEAIYQIKRTNGIYDPKRKCPYCGGYGIDSLTQQYKCHDCYRTFKPQQASEDTSKGATNKKVQLCSYCLGQDPTLSRCPDCGKLLCSQHINSWMHHCGGFVDKKMLEKELLEQGPTESKWINNWVVKHNLSRYFR